VRLLVSVRNETEACAALHGGADIVDAKEPAAGALGQVDRHTLAGIRAAVPAATPLSAALGDVRSVSDVMRACAGLTVPLDFVKLGFAGVSEPERVRVLLIAAVAAVRRLPGTPGVIAVAYADWCRAESLPPGDFPLLAQQVGAAGLLVDTAGKDGSTLRSWCSRDDLLRLGRDASAHGLTYALAGSLGPADVTWVARTGAAIIGVRGAACRGGRSGRVDPALVRRLLGRVRSGVGPQAAGPRSRPGARSPTGALPE
jgi:(5-formylfuran-3-yl)methyl phosphate synthase